MRASPYPALAFAVIAGLLLVGLLLLVQRLVTA